MENLCRKVIVWGFYSLFFLVPLLFYAGSYELFEYNKMMAVYGLTVVIVAAWLVLLISNFKFQLSSWFKSIPRTPLDIPILLYLLSHILSTIFSLDPHASVWGYYSRFHEGLLATVSYILLYYAAVSNLNRTHVIRILKLSVVSAAIVSAYGVFEHFGHSPSCLFITGKFDVDCWVQDVKNRVFATLGQPNWMAAYLDVVILTTLGFFLKLDPRKIRPFLIYLAAIVLLFAALLFTKSRSGILGLFAGLAVFATAFLWQKIKTKSFTLPVKPLVVSLVSLFLVALLFGLPFAQTEKFSVENFLTSKSSTVNGQPAPTVNTGYIDIGISESGDIRRIVWQGAIKVWQRYPILGSGVETFAYAYYKDRPVAHNMVSEWDFLYNKAHNEFLNILATTGTVGMLTYLGILGVFALWFIRLVKKGEPDGLTVALFAAWASILVTNFFGFSVVIIGLFFFLTPAFSFILSERSEPKNLVESSKSNWLPILLILLISSVLLINLANMWRADKAYAYGRNLDSVQRYADAFQYLTSAVASSPNEPTFRDELSYNQAVLASTIFAQIQSSSASGIASLSAQQKMAITIPQLSASTNDLVQQAIDNSNKVVESSPNALTFWKTRTKAFYQLSSIDPKYILDALTAIQKSAELAPTDAKVHYNLGIIYGRVGQVNSAITALEETVAMKPDYRDAYYALALYYKEAGDVTKAKATMQQILTKIGPDPDAKKFLEENP